MTELERTQVADAAIWKLSSRARWAIYVGVGAVVAMMAITLWLVIGSVRDDARRDNERERDRATQAAGERREEREQAERDERNDAERTRLLSEGQAQVAVLAAQLRANGAKLDQLLREENRTRTEVVLQRQAIERHDVQVEGSPPPPVEEPPPSPPPEPEGPPPEEPTCPLPTLCVPVLPEPSSPARVIGGLL